MLENLFFDWYSASIDRPVDEVICRLRSEYPHLSLEIARPKNGYTHADKLVDQAGDTIATLMYGGSAQGTKVNVFSTGTHAHKFAEVIRVLYPQHELVRADVAIDFDESGAWQSLVSHGLMVSRRAKIKNRYVGPADAIMSDASPDGRTLYVGSRQSVSMVRVYEKGKKDDPDRPDWVRAEFEFKPKGAVDRERFALATPAQIVSSTPVGRAFFETLVGSVEVLPVPAGKLRAKTDHERSMAALRRQYGKTLLVELERCGGSVDDFVASLLAGIAA